ncbi:MAG: hypothetical protein C5B57_02525 [Blastocatellia bacterium]|nr:MAG: hypothetical protein C5B57_02525 [Blastocatellia bacterium]
MNRGLRFEPPSVRCADAVEERVDGVFVPDMRVAQGLDRMLEFVSDRRHEFVVVTMGIHDNPQNSIRARRPHRQSETCAHVMPTVTFLNVHNAVRPIDRFDEAPESRG